MASPVLEKIIRACARMGDVEIGGIRLEDGDPKLLNVSEFDLDVHVAIQPSAIAYYGSLKKDALRKLTSLKRQFERWEKKKYAEAKASLGAGTGKTTMNDIESRYIVDNEADITAWDNKIEVAQLEFDTLDIWFEAWRQKSFSIREYAGIEEAERFNSSSSMGGESSQERKISMSESNIQRVRRIIRERAQGKQP